MIRNEVDAERERIVEAVTRGILALSVGPAIMISSGGTDFAIDLEPRSFPVDREPELIVDDDDEDAPGCLDCGTPGPHLCPASLTDEEDGE